MNGPGPADLPFFRKLANGTSYYHVHQLDHFTELQLVGSRCVEHQVEVRSYPERVLLVALYHGDDGRYLPINEDEFQAVRARCSTGG